MNKSEYLTKQFFTWEKRSRGWLCYEVPVYLEPPFIPFIHQFPKSGIIDESKRPTLVSSLIDKLKGKREVMPPEEELLDYESFTPFEYVSPIELTAFRVQIPKVRKISIETWRGFLTMLSQTKSNVSFELVGNKQSIYFQFVCNSEDAQLLSVFLASYFPDHTISENTSYLHLLQQNQNTYILDFSLQEEFVRPLSILKNFAHDPLQGIIGILDQLHGDDYAGIQILFQGAVNNWTPSMVRAVTASDGKSFFADAPDAPKMVEEKLQSPLFGVCIRCFSQEKQPRNIHLLTQSLIQATCSPYNQLEVYDNAAYTYELRESDLYLRESHKLGMLLSADELIPLLHFPSENIVSKKLYHQRRKTTEVPAIARNKKIVLGTNGYDDTQVTIDNKERVQHMHMIGASGSGKSTLIANLILQDIAQGNGLALVDPHGDLVDDIVGRIREEDRHKVILLDPTDMDFPIGLNIVHAHSDIEKIVLASDLVAAFKRASTSWGDQMNTVFSNAVLALLESHQGGSINDLRRFLVEPSFRQTFLKTVHDPSIRYYWEIEYPLLKTNSIGPILTRLDSFLRPKLVRNMVAQKEGLNFERILKEKKILLVKLPLGILGNENSFLLASLIISKIHQAAFARQVEKVRPPFFLYLDEFHNYITPSINELLSGARKFNVGLILSHQHLDQLKREDSELQNAVLGNTYTRIVFRVGEQDAKKVQEGFTHFDATDIYNLGVGQAIVRIEQPKNTTSLETFPLLDISESEKQISLHEIIQNTRLHYAQPKEVIERSIEESLNFYNYDTTKQPEEKFEVIETTNKEVPKKDVESENADPVGAKSIDYENKELGTPQPSLETNLEVFPVKQFENKEEVEIQKEERQKDSVHTYLKHLVKKIGEAKNYKATLEYGILGGSVDVVLERGDEKIAIEISVTTDPVWEVHNIEKCLNLGFTKILSVSGDKKHLVRIEKKAKELISQNTPQLIAFATPDQLYTLLKDEAENSASTTTFKGYRVNVSYTEPSKEESISTGKNIAKTLLTSIRKQKEKKE